MAKKTAPPTISKEQCEQYESLNETRLSLQRQARTLQGQLDKIEEKLLAFVRENGEKHGKGRISKKFGFVLGLELKSCAPSWKDEFIRVAGLEEAEQVAAAAAERKKESFSLARA